MPFSENTLRFLRDLERNNEREWFQPRKGQYEELVRAPMFELVEFMNQALGKTGPDYVTDPQKAVLRVYRDTRFSKDKTPYKTHVAAYFPHRLLGKNGGAGLYMHLSAQEFLIAGGLYHSPPEIMLPVRQHIAERYESLTSILQTRAIRRSFGDLLQGDQMRRPPRGFRADHPAADYLRRKDLLLETVLAAGQGLGRGAFRETRRRFLAMLPFVQFLNEPMLAHRKRAARDPLMTF